jgi:hypothetical protein
MVGEMLGLGFSLFGIAATPVYLIAALAVMRITSPPRPMRRSEEQRC